MSSAHKLSHNCPVPEEQGWQDNVKQNALRL